MTWKYNPNKPFPLQSCSHSLCLLQQQKSKLEQCWDLLYSSVHGKLNIVFLLSLHVLSSVVDTMSLLILLLKFTLYSSFNYFSVNIERHTLKLITMTMGLSTFLLEM